MPSLTLPMLVKTRVRAHHLWLLLFFSSSSLVLLRFSSIPVGAFFDDAHYIVLAESLAGGQGYRLINFPHAPLETAFPPGWPLLLVPATMFFDGSLMLLKVVSFGFWVGSLGLLYLLVAPYLESPYREMYLALVALNPHLVGMAGTVMSEAAYLFFSLLALYLFDRWQRERPSYALLILALGTAVFTLTVRTIGIALLGGLLLALLLNGRRRRLLLIGGLLVVGLFPLAWFNQHNGGAFVFSPAYRQHFDYVFSRLGDFVRFWEYGAALNPETVASAVVPLFDLSQVRAILTPALNRGLSLLVLLLVAGGFVGAARRSRPQAFYVAGYLAIFYLWAVYINEIQPRILLPLIPFLTLYLLVAMRWLAARMARQNVKQAQLMALGALSLLLLVMLARNYHAWQNPIRERVVDLSAGAAWVQAHAPADAVLMTANPVPDYLYARRLTVGYPPAGADVKDYLQENEIDYVLIRPLLQRWENAVRQLDPVTARELVPFLQTNSSQFQIVYAHPEQNVTVYQVLGGEEVE